MWMMEAFKVLLCFCLLHLVTGNINLGIYKLGLSSAVILASYPIVKKRCLNQVSFLLSSALLNSHLNKEEIRILCKHVILSSLLLTTRFLSN